MALVPRALQQAGPVLRHSQRDHDRVRCDEHVLRPRPRRGPLLLLAAARRGRLHQLLHHLLGRVARKHLDDSRHGPVGEEVLP